MNNNPQLIIHNGKAVTTSRNLADAFGKHHKNVIRDIEKICSDLPKEFRRLNFEPSSYLNEQNKKQPMYEITRDGFAILAMGFTGKKALTFKVRYINAFNQMEAEILRLKHRQQPARISDWKAVLEMMKRSGDDVHCAFSQALHNLGFTIQGDTPEKYRIVPPSILIRLIDMAKRGNKWARNLLKRSQQLDVPMFRPTLIR